MSKSVRVSVREIAAFAGRTGDLSSHHISLLRGSDGIRAHRRLQSARAPASRREVSVQGLWQGRELTLEIHGRIDLLHETDDGLLVEEIKTTRLPEGEFPPDASVHRLQALLYAWLLGNPARTPAQRTPAQQVNVPAACVRYVPPDSGTGWVWKLEITASELLAEISSVCAAYEDWLIHLLHWREQRDQSLVSLPFPYPELRPGQPELMQAVERCFRMGERLYAEAPTGIGKTLAVLLPALRALGEGRIQTLFYATCRNSGKSVVQDAIHLLQSEGMQLRALTLVARERICNATGSPCDCSACPLALGFFDRLNAALAELREQPDWSRPVWEAIAARHRLCPFAFLMRAAREADLLIGDINYVLDPSAKLAFLFDTAPETVGLLLDEAHHLPERARDMYSASLDLAAYSKALRALPPELRGLQTDLRRVLRTANALALIPQGDNTCTEAVPRELGEACRRALLALEQSLQACAPVANDPRHSLMRTLQDFWLSIERHQPSHITYREGQTLHHLCRDPAEVLRGSLDTLFATVLFSATLSPLPLFRQLTGATPENREVSLASPFDPTQFPVELEADIPVTYSARGPETYRKLANRILRFLQEHPGKNMVFFPSFEVMQQVRTHFPEEDLWFGTVLSQPRGLQETETTEFLRPLRESKQAVTVLAALGGALNEGIDLPGEQLTGVVVVSIGLPAVSARQELLRDYHQRQGREGFVLAYTLPGYLRVRQALGRVIRGPHDRGRALLIDPRFQHPFYRELLQSGQGIQPTDRSADLTSF